MLKIDYLDLLRNVTVVLLHIPMPVFVYFSTNTYRYSLVCFFYHDFSFAVIIILGS